MTEHDARSRVALALDVPELQAALDLVDETRAHVGVFKIGLELFTSSGPEAVEAIQRADARCFLDLKVHDIPATTERTVRAAERMGVDFLTIHAAAGRESLTAAASAARKLRLLAVTVLTSLDENALREIGYDGGTQASVSRLAELAWETGIRGFVSSASECRSLRGSLGREAFVVTPGVRPVAAAADDQKRVATPTEAILEGSDLIVVGRPIRDADDPAAAAEALVQEVALALRR